MVPLILADLNDRQSNSKKLVLHHRSVKPQEEENKWIGCQTSLVTISKLNGRLEIHARCCELWKHLVLEV